MLEDIAAARDRNQQPSPLTSFKFEVYWSNMLHTRDTLTAIGQDRVFFEDCDGRQLRDVDVLGGTQQLQS